MPKQCQSPKIHWFSTVFEAVSRSSLKYRENQVDDKAIISKKLTREKEPEKAYPSIVPIAA